MRTLSAILSKCPLSFLLAGTAHTQWMQTNGPYGGTVNCLAVSGTNLFAMAQYDVYLTTNNGTSWTQTYTPFTSFSAMVQIDSNLFAGTDGGGVFLSTDNGTNWIAIMVLRVLMSFLLL